MARATAPVRPRRSREETAFQHRRGDTTAIPVSKSNGQSGRIPRRRPSQAGAGRHSTDGTRARKEPTPVDGKTARASTSAAEREASLREKAERIRRGETPLPAPEPELIASAPDISTPAPARKPRQRADRPAQPRRKAPQPKATRKPRA